MKKYFLLATTALLLGTSNVMAGGVGDGAGGSVSTTMLVSGTIASTPTIEILDDVNWGIIYLSGIVDAPTADVAYFDETGFHAEGDHTINGYAGQVQGKIKVSNLPAGAIVSVPYEVEVSDKFAMMGNEFIAGSNGEYLLISTLEVRNDGEPVAGDVVGSFPITITY